MKNVKISICIFTYNRSKFISDAIKSALNQNCNEYEIIIIDDGSTDNTRDIIQNFNSQTIKYIKQNNFGRPAARNKAIEEAKGDYIIWLGSDDALKTGIVNFYQEIINTNIETDIFYSNIIVTDEYFRFIRKIEYEDWKEKNKELTRQMALNNVIPDGGTLIRKRLYSLYGGYDTLFKQSQDYEWFSRIAHVAQFKYTNKTAYYWRTHSGDRAANSNGKIFDAIIVERLVNMHSNQIFLSLNEIKSLNDDEKKLLGATRYAMRLFKLGQADKAARLLLNAIKFTKNPSVKIQLAQIAKSMI